ncbi:MAG: SDR family NAD(P)-dependent oxidoreductase, partial [Acidobacteria bacterium]|nr:SDR family NAD(P)-dependent oxidoreductase [Acidobacteriota bacterium]
MLAEYLAVTVKARLVLTGRTVFPIRSNWENWLNVNSKNNRISRLIKKIRHLEELGARVSIFSADVSDLEQMRNVIDCVEREFGSVNGVIHAAGLIEPNTFHLVDHTTAIGSGAQFKSKIGGLLVLDSIFRDVRLDFLVVMSSISSVLGGLRFASYAAANLFMDSFIWRRAQDKVGNWLSVNWDAWRFDVGPTVTSVSRDELAELTINTNEGATIFKLIFSGIQFPQIIVSTGDLNKRIDKWINTIEMVRELELPFKEDKAEPDTFLKRPSLSQSYVAPHNKIEQAIVEIWRKFLGIDSIGINDDFFELGGNSLKALLLVTRIKKELDVNIPLATIFQTKTIKGLSEYIKKKKEKNKFTPIEISEKKEYYSLSSPQKRLYILHQLEEGNTAYNITQMISLDGEIKKEKLKNTFSKLITRHESLRTSFILVNEEPAQKIHDIFEFEIEYFSASETEAKFKVEDTIKRFIKTFDLSQELLLRVGLIKLEPYRHILMVDMHHIISDGISLSILITEFMALYGEEELPFPRLQYKDFSAWQNGSQKDKFMKEQHLFWINEFENNIPMLNLPVDYLRSAVQSFEGETVKFEIDKQNSTELKRYASNRGNTIYIILLSIYTIFLSKITGQEDIVVGSPVTGRRHIDLENIIGMFVNTLAMRNYPVGSMPFSLFLEKVKVRTLKVLDNQDYPFENLVEALSMKRHPDRNPLFDTMLVLQNIEIPEIKIPGLKLKPYENNNNTSLFDLTLAGVEKEEKIYLYFNYCTKIFKKETIERFINFFKKVLFTVLDNPDIKLSEIEII